MIDDERAVRSLNEIIAYCRSGYFCSDERCVFKRAGYHMCDFKKMPIVCSLLGGNPGYIPFDPNEADLQDVMSVIAAYYGLELDEEFTIDDTKSNLIYKLTKDGMYLKVGNGEWYKNQDCKGTILLYLEPRKHIHYHPWKPAHGEGYYFIADEKGNVVHGVFNMIEIQSQVNIKFGNYFPTEELARKHAKEIIEKIKKNPINYL